MSETLSPAHRRLTPKRATFNNNSMRVLDSRTRINLKSSVETKEACISEDEKRVKLIRATLSIEEPVSWLNLDKTAAEVLAKILEFGADSADPQLTLASSLTMRENRVRVIGRLLAALHGYRDDELCTFTVLNRSWVFTPQELNSKTAAQIKNQFQTHLKRAGVFDLPGPFVAFLHGEFEPTKCVFVLHYHGVTTAEKAARLPALKELAGYEKTDTNAAPIMSKKVRNRKKQLTYLLKSFWPQKAVRKCADGKERRDRGISRVPGIFHTQYLLWLDQQNLGDMTILNDCWSRRDGGPAAMRELYLSIFGRREEGPEQGFIKAL